MRTQPITPEEERAIEKAFYDALPMRAECSLCSWFYEGQSSEALERAAEHRRERHPEAKSTRRKTRSLRSFRSKGMTKDDLDEIDTARKRRAYLIGIEIEE